MKKIILLIIVTINTAFFSFSQTSISAGTVNGNWTLAGSPYLVQGNISIPDGASLVIEPGVTISFQGTYKFSIQGRLIAIGTSSDTIVFTAANTTNGWKGIRFDNTPQTNDTSFIKFCKIQYAKAANGSYPDNAGGGLFINNTSKILISNSAIVYCKATRGAAIFTVGYGCSPKIINNVISYNTHESDGGGAIYCDGSSTPFIYSNLISYNSAIGAGAFAGGITCSSGGPVISNNTIIYNSTYMNGGGINCMGCSASFSNNTIANNTSAAFGGGIYSGSISHPNYINNIVSNNQAVKGGGLFFTAASNDSLMGNLIANNSATADGGGIYCQSASASPIINTTLVNNNAVNGGGVFCDGGSNPKFGNSIVYGNTATGAGAQVFLNDENSDPPFLNCNIQGGFASIEANGNFYSGLYQNNMNTVPFFVSPSGGSGNSFDGLSANWALQASSPCIDAGYQSGDYPDYDVAGNARVTVCIVDMGAYEFQNGIPFKYELNIYKPVSCRGTSTGELKVHVTSGAPPYSYLWSNGSTDSVAANLSAGNYTVTVSESNSGCSVSKSINLAENANVFMYVDAGSDVSFQCGDTIRFSAHPNGYSGNGTLSYSWYPSEGLSNDTILNPLIYIAAQKTYYLQAISTEGCIAMDSVEVIPHSFMLFGGGDKSVTCDGLVRLDSVHSDFHGVGSLSFSWSPSIGLSDSTVAAPFVNATTETIYYLTVSSQNGCEAKDSITVHINPLVADAGTDKTLVCDGITYPDNISTNYNGTGSLSYAWSPSALFDNDSVVTPAISLLSDTMLFVTVTTPHGCSATDSIFVSIHPITLNTGNVKALICGGSVQLDSVTSSYNGSGVLSYSWLPSVGLNSYSIANPTAEIIANSTYTITAVSPNGCMAIDSIDVIVDPLIINGTMVFGICGSSIMLSTTNNYNGSDSLYYLWSPSSGISDSTSNNPVVLIDSAIQYTVYLTTSNGCTANTSVNVGINQMDAPEICIVGVDSVNKNRIIWNKPTSTAIDSFYVYKETNITNVYQKIGSVLYDSLSIFIDTNSFPDVQSNKYKIAIKDKCGLVSDLSSSHKTMHLSVNQGQGTTWNLIWDAYEGFTVATYNVYRGNSAGNLQLIGTSAGSNTQYSDVNAPSGTLYYQVELIGPNQCNPTRSYNSSKSNVVNTDYSGIIENVVPASLVKIFPNPAKESIMMKFENIAWPQQYTYTIINARGQEIVDLKNVSNQNEIIDISSLAYGIYSLKIVSGTTVIVKKLVKQ